MEVRKRVSKILLITPPPAPEKFLAQRLLDGEPPMCHSMRFVFSTIFQRGRFAMRGRKGDFYHALQKQKHTRFYKRDRH